MARFKVANLFSKSQLREVSASEMRTYGLARSKSSDESEHSKFYFAGSIGTLQKVRAAIPFFPKSKFSWLQALLSR